jgi:predicted aspartyl protease
MIRGVVNARHEATIQLRVRGSGGSERDLEAVIDTGLTGSLTLPAVEINALGLIRVWGGGAVLADGTFRPFDIYAAEVEWDGAWRPVLVAAIGQEALVGMRLLTGHGVWMEVVPGGVVEVTPVTRSTP